MPRDTNRGLPLLRERRVINDLPGLATANQGIRLSPQRRLQRRAVPKPRTDEMVEPVIAERFGACRHRLDALAIAGANQAGDVGRAHPSPRLVAQILQIRLEPAFQIALPILFHRQPPSKLAPYQSRIFPAGNPKNHTYAKVVIGLHILECLLTADCFCLREPSRLVP